MKTPRARAPSSSSTRTLIGNYGPRSNSGIGSLSYWKVGQTLYIGGTELWPNGTGETVT
jgi:hypothetical protein